MNNDWQRLIKNLTGLAIIGIAGFAIYYFFFHKNEENFKLEETPIQIESIKTIAELSTLSYKDEVVMDTMEYTKNDHSFYDPRKWYKEYYHNVKRRLTIIVKGEVRFGINLNNGNFEIKKETDTVFLHFPKVKITEVIVSPTGTEVYEEMGTWNDNTRTLLEDQARLKLKKNAREMNLEKRAEENIIRMFKRLLNTEKELIISFDHD